MAVRMMAMTQITNAVIPARIDLSTRTIFAARMQASPHNPKKKLATETMIIPSSAPEKPDIRERPSTRTGPRRKNEAATAPNRTRKLKIPRRHRLQKFCGWKQKAKPEAPIK
jgi:hypothetical protein|tara:strand:- start:431 stop:766 length:336 start_codon:yes stop_codon:yes gene_type:complete